MVLFPTLQFLLTSTSTAVDVLWTFFKNVDHSFLYNTIQFIYLFCLLQRWLVSTVSLLFSSLFRGAFQLGIQLLLLSESRWARHVPCLTGAANWERGMLGEHMSIILGLTGKHKRLPWKWRKNTGEIAFFRFKPHQIQKIWEGNRNLVTLPTAMSSQSLFGWLIP